jgi:hypothetical protein
VAPRGFALNESGGANMFLFEKVSDSAGSRWVALTGSAVNKKDIKTLMWYRLAKKAVNERADIKESVRALLLKSLEASGVSGPESPWHAVLSAGNFTLDVFIHERKSSTAGLVMYQLALVAAAESMSCISPELAETMATVKRNMTAGSKSGEGPVAPRYFTMRGRESSGISLAVVAAAPAVKRKASEGGSAPGEADRREEGEAGEAGGDRKATRVAGPFYLEQRP